MNVWGTFHHDLFYVKYSRFQKRCCEIHFTPEIHIWSEITNKFEHAKGDLAGYTPHEVDLKTGKMTGGKSHSPTMTDVLAHERGHARAYMEVMKPLIEAEFESYCDKQKYKTKAEQQQFERRIRQKLYALLENSEYLIKSSEYANSATLSFYDNEDYNEIDPVLPSVYGPDHPDVEVVYAWEKKVIVFSLE